MESRAQVWRADGTRGVGAQYAPGLRHDCVAQRGQGRGGGPTGPFAWPSNPLHQIHLHGFYAPLGLDAIRWKFAPSPLG
jgi:hypothetical protein